MHTMSSGGLRLARAAFTVTLGFAVMMGFEARAADSFIPRLVNTSTIPANGDLNPYGVAFVPRDSLRAE